MHTLMKSTKGKDSVGSTKKKVHRVGSSVKCWNGVNMIKKTVLQIWINFSKTTKIVLKIRVSLTTKQLPKRYSANLQYNEHNTYQLADCTAT